MVGSLLLIALSIPRFGCIRIEPYYFPFPARAVALLKQSGVRGNMAVPFDWGEYVIWHLGPGVKVSIDGRRETVYSDEVYRQSRDFERGTGRWDALLMSKPATDLVLTANGSPTANLLSRTEGWTALYQDTYALMFVRAGFPDLTRLLQTPVPALPDDGDKLCFPAPRISSGGAPLESGPIGTGMFSSLPVPRRLAVRGRPAPGGTAPAGPARARLPGSDALPPRKP